MLAGPLPSISIPAYLLPLNPACLLVLCFFISHTCWYDDSLSAVHAGVVPRYGVVPYLLSLSVVPAGSCLLV